MSSIDSFPERPGEARWYGGFVRSGHGITVTDVWEKFFDRPALRMVMRSERGGGSRA